MKTIGKIWKYLCLTGPLILLSGTGEGQISNFSEQSYHPRVHKMAIGSGITRYDLGSSVGSELENRKSHQSALESEPNAKMPGDTLTKNHIHTAIVPNFKNAGVSGAFVEQNGAGQIPDAYVYRGWPISHERASVTAAPGRSADEFQVPVTSRPYRFIGKLKVRFGTVWANCTATLIKPGLILTAAHCVQGFGKGATVAADEVRWYPAHYLPGTGGYFGSFEAESVFVPSSYADGTDTCISDNDAIPSKICNNDIAVVALKKRGGFPAWAILGKWLNYSWNSYSFSSMPDIGDGAFAIVNQFGYAHEWDSGNQLQRNTTISKIFGTTGTNGELLEYLKSGSPMSAAGASGGPWIVNFGSRPRGSGWRGDDFSRNVIVGVTSWHKRYSTSGPSGTPELVNHTGSSKLGINAEYQDEYGSHGWGNIAALVFAACTALPDNC